MYHRREAAGRTSHRCARAKHPRKSRAASAVVTVILLNLDRLSRLLDAMRAMSELR